MYLVPCSPGQYLRNQVRRITNVLGTWFRAELGYTINGFESMGYFVSDVLGYGVSHYP